MTRRVLVADDDLVTRTVLVTVLELEGDEVEVAEDGREALACIAAGVFDVVVLDHAMPGLTGVEVLARLRADESTATLPVVLLTGSEEPSGVADPLELGAQAFIRKPFSPLHLVEVLDEVATVRS